MKKDFCVNIWPYCMLAKRKKKQDAISKYWKAQAMTLAEQSNDAPKDNSQDERDHSCRPTDPQAATSSSPKKEEH